MTNNVINHIGTQHGPIVGPQSDCSGLWATINTYLHGIMVWSQSWSIIWWYGPKVSMVPKYGPKVGTASHSWYFGTLEWLEYRTLEHWNSWYFGTVGTVGIVSWNHLCQHHFFVSIISLSMTHLCQHHFFVSTISLSATCYCQWHVIVSDMLLSATHLCQWHISISKPSLSEQCWNGMMFFGMMFFGMMFFGMMFCGTILFGMMFLERYSLERLGLLESQHCDGIEQRSVEWWHWNDDMVEWWYWNDDIVEWWYGSDTSPWKHDTFLSFGIVERWRRWRGYMVESWLAEEFRVHCSVIITWIIGQTLISGQFQTTRHNL